MVRIQRARALAIAAVFAGAYVALGLAVSRRPPSTFDRSYELILAHGKLIEVAWIFTASCLLPVLASFGAGALVLAALNRSWRIPAVTSIVLTLAGWVTSDVLKGIFGRARPEHWLRVHETSNAYSSGHAMYAVIVYGLWAWFVLRSGLPTAMRRAVSSLLVLWALGVCWSRLALGAHYPTDVIGGLLLGATLVSLAFTLLGTGRLAPR